MSADVMNILVNLNKYKINCGVSSQLIMSYNIIFNGMECF